jgi:hypothetical protein
LTFPNGHRNVLSDKQFRKAYRPVRSDDPDIELTDDGVIDCQLGV